MINFKQFLLCVIFFILFGIADAYSMVSISLPDTVIPQGKTAILKVTGSLGDSAAQNLKVTIIYNALAINIKSVSGGPDYAMQCPQPLLNKTYPKPDSALIEISCDNIQKSSNTLFALEIEALAGSDTISGLIPKSIFLNGVETAINSKDTGIIRVTGMPIFPMFPEGMGKNYPNPFFDQTHLKFSINKPTTVRFTIFSTSGQDIAHTGDGLNKFDIYTSDNKLIDITNPVLQKGAYRLDLTVAEPWTFSSGAYYLVMKTDEGLYNISILLFK